MSEPDYKDLYGWAVKEISDLRDQLEMAERALTEAEEAWFEDVGAGPGDDFEPSASLRQIRAVLAAPKATKKRGGE